MNGTVHNDNSNVTPLEQTASLCEGDFNSKCEEGWADVPCLDMELYLSPLGPHVTLAQ